MPSDILNDISHRRYDPLRGSWILVSPHRTKRPWQGQEEPSSKTTTPSYDPKCYLCPGNKRAQGDLNPQYDQTFVFVNDYSALRAQQADYVPERPDSDNGDFKALESTFLRAEAETGMCYVITFSPRHDLTLADMPVDQIQSVIATWTYIYSLHVSPQCSLAAVANSLPTPPEPLLAHSRIAPPAIQYRHMQIFENKGAAMGCSNPHPHGQIWTSTQLPNEPALELRHQMEYRKTHAGRHMLGDYAALEVSRSSRERVVFSNESWAVVCPWWATWPFETMILPRRHVRCLLDVAQHEGMQAQLAEALAETTRRYDRLFGTSFPYSMGIHQAPLAGTDEEIDASYLHFHFYPPLLRSATVRKFFVGYEMMAEPQRDLTPEQAARRLQSA